MHGHDGRQRNNTRNVPMSWMSVDIGENRWLAVSYYCLRQGVSSGFRMRNWGLQGCNDGLSWQMLCKHERDFVAGGGGE